MISVIVPTYNRSQWLPQAIASVLHQTCTDFEIIIVDDGSTDSTKEAVTNLQCSKVRYIRHETNRGSAASRNTGIGAAKGEFIAFLDDDDEWLPEKLKKQLDKFRTVEEAVGIVYTGSSIVSARTGETIHTFTSHSPEHKDVDFLRAITFATSVPLIRKYCFDDVGLFDEALPGAQDKDMWIRLARRYKFDYIPETLVKRYVHGEQITSDLKAKIEAKEKIYSKYYDVLLNHSEIMAHHLWRLGILYCIDNRSTKGMNCFRKAILQQPTKTEFYRDFFLSILAPKKHRRILIDTSIGNIDGVRLYY